MLLVTFRVFITSWGELVYSLLIVSPCPLPAAITSHCFHQPIALTIWPPRICISAGKRRYSLDDCSPGKITDVVGSVFTKLCHIILFADRLSYIEVKVINSVVKDIFVRSLLSWLSSLRNYFLVIFQCPC